MEKIKNKYGLITFFVFCFCVWIYSIFDTWLILILVPISLIFCIIFGWSKKRIWLYLVLLLMIIYTSFLLFWPNYECDELVLPNNDISGNTYLAHLELQGKVKSNTVIPDCNCSVVKWHKTNKFKCYIF
jgi:energy-coupling factor transporter transmembrane protein EcfT